MYSVVTLSYFALRQLFVVDNKLSIVYAECTMRINNHIPRPTVISPVWLAVSTLDAYGMGLYTGQDQPIRLLNYC